MTLIFFFWAPVIKPPPAPKAIDIGNSSQKYSPFIGKKKNSTQSR